MVNKSKSNNNVVAVTSVLLNYLGVKYNIETLREKLVTHPNFPSLLAISDILNELGVSNRATKHNKKIDDFNTSKLSYPLIAQVEYNGDHFYFIDKNENGDLIYSDETSEVRKISEEEFLTRWTGISLNATANSDSIEVNYFENRLKYALAKTIKPGLLVSLILLLVIVITSRPLTEAVVAIYLVKIAQLILATFLLVYSLNSNNSFLQNICNISKKTNCNAILQSKGARITNWLSWSDIGFCYFGGGLMLLLVNPSTIYIVGILNVVAIPYTLYSIGYQYKAKHWCLLCCLYNCWYGLKLSFLQPD